MSIYLKSFHNVIFDENSFSNILILSDFALANKFNLRFWIINHHNIWVDQSYILNEIFELLWIYFVWFNFDTSNWKNYINFFFAQIYRKHIVFLEIFEINQTQFARVFSKLSIFRESRFFRFWILQLLVNDFVVILKSWQVYSKRVFWQYNDQKIWNASKLSL